MSMATENLPLIEMEEWKPPKNISYETMVLTNTALNKKIRPAGYRSDGKFRQIKGTCLLSKIRTRCRIRQMNPRMAVCVTMYNEDEQELKNTLEGVLHNYNCLKLDPTTAFTKDDFTIVLVCDGYDKITEDFKKFARERHFLDEQSLVDRGFMYKDRDGKFRMKPMRDLFDDDVADEDIPQNMCHVF